MEKKAFLKCLVALLLFGSNGVVAAWIPLSSLHIVLLRTLLGGLFLGETMLPLQIIGAVLMIGGAMVCELVKKKPAQ